MTNAPYRVGERRPIAAREWSISGRLAGGLARRGVSANAISMSGMVCGIAAGIALAATSEIGSTGGRALWLVAAVLIQCRLLANLLDGMVAIASGRASTVGELYNELPDRVSDTSILVGAGYAMGGWPALGFAAALSAMFTAYVRAVGRGLGMPQEFCGPMAKPQRMNLLTLVALYLALAPDSWRPSWGPDGAWGLSAAGLLVIAVGGLITAGRRLGRIVANLNRKEPTS